MSKMRGDYWREFCDTCVFRAPDDKKCVNPLSAEYGAQRALNAHACRLHTRGKRFRQLERYINE